MIGGKIAAWVGIAGAIGSAVGIVLAITWSNWPMGVLSGAGLLVSAIVGFSGLLWIGLSVLAEMDD